MTLEEIDKRIAECKTQQEQFVAQANIFLGKVQGKLELLEEMRGALMVKPEPKKTTDAPDN